MNPTARRCSSAASVLRCPSRSVRVFASAALACSWWRRSCPLRLISVRRVDTVHPSSIAPVTAIPEGFEALRLHLRFEAAPDQIMPVCWVVAEDSHGVRYGGSSVSDPLGQINTCVPDKAPGPQPAYFDATKRKTPTVQRPRAWDTYPVVLVRKGAAITHVLVGGNMPMYARLPLPDGV